MKNTIFKFLFAALAVCLLGLALQSAGNKATEAEKEEISALNSGGTYFAAVGGYVRANYRLDTITNGELDTIGLVGRNSTTLNNAVASYTPFISLYTLDVMVTRTIINGTPSVKVFLEKSATTIPTAGGWLTIDSTSSVTGTANIKVSEITGEIYRLRVKGVGTQNTAYKINCLLKKKN